MSRQSTGSRRPYTGSDMNLTDIVRPRTSQNASTSPQMYYPPLPPTNPQAAYQTPLSTQPPFQRPFSVPTDFNRSEEDHSVNSPVLSHAPSRPSFSSSIPSHNGYVSWNSVFTSGPDHNNPAGLTYNPAYRTPLPPSSHRPSTALSQAYFSTNSNLHALESPVNSYHSPLNLQLNYRSHHSNSPQLNPSPISNVIPQSQIIHSNPNLDHVHNYVQRQTHVSLPPTPQPFHTLQLNDPSLAHYPILHHNAPSPYVNFAPLPYPTAPHAQPGISPRPPSSIHPNHSPMPRPVSHQSPLAHPRPGYPVSIPEVDENDFRTNASYVLRAHTPHSSHEISRAHTPRSFHDIPGSVRLEPQGLYAPPLHYATPPAPVAHSDSSTTSLTALLASIKETPILDSSTGWSAWNESIQDALMAGGLLPHILNDMPPDTTPTPYNTPSFCPSFTSYPPPPYELEVEARWRQRDQMAVAIITNRLSLSAKELLPPRMLPSGFPRTARDCMNALESQYSLIKDTGGLVDMEFTLLRSGVADNDVQKFVGTWKTGVQKLYSAGWNINWVSYLTAFSNFLPRGDVYSDLVSSIRRHVNNNLPLTYAHFTHVMEDALRLARDDTRRVAQNAAARALRTGLSSTGSSNKDKDNKKSKKGQSHNAGSNQNTLHGGATTAPATSSNTATVQSSSMAKANVATTALPTPTDTSNNGNVASVPATTTASNMINRSSYPVQHKLKPLAALANILNDLHSSDSFAFASIVSSKTILLDSACTHHIIRDRSYFHDYDPTGALDVTTASSGSLHSLAAGTCILRIPLVNSSTCLLLTLNNCLHAPDAPMNLISVGALLENGFAMTLSHDHANIEIPRTRRSDESGIFRSDAFRGSISHRLIFVDGEFVLPDSDSLAAVSVAFPTFSPRPIDGNCWHERFCHIGREKVHKVLNGNFGTGLESWTGIKMDAVCSDCWQGKCPRSSHHGTSAPVNNPLELLVMDTCGPMPVQSPRGEVYFHIIADTKTSAFSVACLKKRPECHDHIVSTINSWEIAFNSKVVSVRADGAKEFNSKRTMDFFSERGIKFEPTPPYAHWMNGKAERWIRTIEEGALTLVIASGLPLSFWADAVLAVAYVLFRMPTRSLPNDVTPYEILHKKKPDYSHLRVWGCQVFFWVPDELRSKLGRRYEEGIFVGYSDGGWIVRDLSGKYHNIPHGEAKFNEGVMGKLASPKSSSRSNSHLGGTEVNRDEFLSKLRSRGTPKDSPVAAPAFSDVQSYAHASSILSDVYEPSAFPHEYAFHAFSNVPWFDHPLSSHVMSVPPLACPAVLSTDLRHAPRTRSEMLRRSDSRTWLDAELVELEGLRTKNVYVETSLPEARKTIGLKWVYTWKLHADGSIKKAKARLVVRGFTQRPEDYGKTYAPVIRTISFRIVLAWAAREDLELFVFDVKQAFLNAVLHEDVYCKQIPGHPCADKNTVLKLLRALYGLCQASHEWYNTLRSALEQIGLVRSDIDPAMFWGKWSAPPDSGIVMPTDGSPLFLLIPIHVDDGLAATNSGLLYLWFLSRLSTFFEVEDLGVATLYLGVSIRRNRKERKIYLNQGAYLLDLLEQHGLVDCVSHPVPMNDYLHKLSDDPKFDNLDIPRDAFVRSYQAIVGSINWPAIISRPDLSFAATALGQHNADPKRKHLLAAKRVLRYIWGTLDLWLEMGGSQLSDSLPSLDFPLDCVAFSDADWATDSTDRRSVSGFAIFLFGGLVGWSSKKQRAVALSSAESEYMAITHLLKELLWLRVFTSSLELPTPRPFPLVSDSKSAISMANSESISSNAKHIDIRFHFIRSHIEEGSFVTHWICSSDMVADIFTKPLSKELFTRHRTRLGLVDGSLVSFDPVTA